MRVRRAAAPARPCEGAAAPWQRRWSCRVSRRWRRWCGRWRRGARRRRGRGRAAGVGSPWRGPAATQEKPRRREGERERDRWGVRAARETEEGYFWSLVV
ncbi:hypothetical protein SETIT_7G087900v2 [Setaria italica]|uniref:Uncharacterized protein n=1 Tax=Setaria italica TaxID=4555 RepID=A0A368RTV2_SETIT|nr:hypothetical protein SETIT_7G087900v2 [Setaria italica]